MEWRCEETPPPSASPPEVAETDVGGAGGGNATAPRGNPCFVASSPFWGSGASFTNFDLAALRHAASVTMPSMGW